MGKLSGLTRERILRPEGQVAASTGLGVTSLATRQRLLVTYDGADGGRAMTDLILVHGGWQGGWCWDQVAARLRASGHRVLAPTLLGSEPVDHPASQALARGDLGLAAIGDDLVRQIHEAGFDDAVLVGHSGGGPVVQHAADRLGDVIRRTVFVDAFIQRDGESTLDLQPSGAAFRQLAESRPDRCVTIDPQRFADDFMNGAHPDLIEDVTRRLVPLSLRQLEEPLHLTAPPGSGPSPAFVFLQDDRSIDPVVWRGMADRLDSPDLFTCVGPHEAMLTHPDELAAVLLTAAS